MPRTQEDRKADTRARLVRAAMLLFAERGVDAVSVDAIAEAADRTSGAVYAHFGGKPGLVLAVLDELRSELAGAIATEADANDALRRRLGTLWRNFRAPPGDDDRRGLWVVLEHELWLRAARDPEVASALAERYAVGRRQMATSFAGWAATNDAAPAVGPNALPTLVLALLLGLEMQHRLDPRAVPDHVAVAGLAALFGTAAP